MKSSHFLGENFVEDASAVHQDHEVQMAREELYHAAEYALRLHKLLRNVDETQGLEGWVSSKITLANDYLKTVLEYMEYELMTAASQDMGSEQVIAVAESKELDEDAVDDFLAKGGEIKKGKYHKPRRSERTDYGSKHIGTGKGGKKSSQSGTAANVGKSGKPVVTAESQTVQEMTAGSVATVVNPTPKNRAKTGTLFGGTYKQPKTKAKK
jgi:hypothetical protein